MPNTAQAVVGAKDLQEEPLTLAAADSSCSLEGSHKEAIAQGKGYDCTEVDTCPSSLRCMAADHPGPVPGPVLGSAAEVVVAAAAAAADVVVEVGTGAAAVAVDATLVVPAMAQEEAMLTHAPRGPALTLLLQNLPGHHPDKAPMTAHMQTWTYR